MTSNALIRFLVTICMLAGLIVGPAQFAASSHAMSASTAGVAMPDDMDCCAKGPSDPGCAKCPLMALCSTPFAEHLVDHRLPEVVARIIRRAAPTDEASLASRNAQPLPEPPRSSV